MNHCGAGEPLTFVQPVFDVGLSGVDGLPGLAAHVVDVGAELPGPTQVDCHAHGQLLQTSSFLRQPDGLRVFLRKTRKQAKQQEVFTVCHLGPPRRTCLSRAIDSLGMISLRFRREMKHRPWYWFCPLSSSPRMRARNILTSCRRH